MDFAYARKAAGLSQQRLADLAGCHKSQIQRLEYGKILPANLTAITYLRLCWVLDLDPWDLLEEQE